MIVRGLKEFEIWLKLFKLNSNPFHNSQFKSKYEIAQLLNDGCPSSFVKRIVNEACVKGFIFEKDGFLLIDVNKLSDALGELPFYDLMSDLVHFND